MKSIIIRGFQSLDNYGTGMMGLITIHRLAAMTDQPMRFLCDFYPGTDIAEVQAELGLGPEKAILERQVWPPRAMGKWSRRFHSLKRSAVTGSDMAIVLGGDAISEYYRPSIWRVMMGFWRWSLEVPVILLGQTIGPFHRLSNRLGARAFFARVFIVARDRWTTAYLADELGLRRKVRQGTDLAYSDLPLQHRTDIEADVLAHYGLETNNYCTFVISALQKSGYYTSDRETYLQRWCDIIARIAALPEMQDKKICLLAHTFTDLYGDEARNVREIAARLPDTLQARLVAIPDRILQTRARFVLGNGLFTVTGRMHPAVSTFQMGKPAISLSYSKKYEGVIGTMLGRGDLIVEANDAELWSSGQIVDRTEAVVADVLSRHAALCGEIRAAIERQKTELDRTFDEIGAMIGLRRA